MVIAEPVQWMNPNRTGAPLRLDWLRTNDDVQPGSDAAASGTFAGTLGWPSGCNLCACACTVTGGSDCSCSLASAPDVSPAAASAFCSANTLCAVPSSVNVLSGARSLSAESTLKVTSVRLWP